MTNEDICAIIKQMIHKVDLTNRPYIAFMHPDMIEAVKKAVPEIEEKIVLQPTTWVEKEKCYVMKRKDLEITIDTYMRWNHERPNNII